MAIEELRRLIERHANRVDLPVAGLTVAAVSEPSPPLSTLAQPVLAVVAQGTKRLVFGDRVYEYGASDYIVVSVDVPVTGQFLGVSPAAPFLGVGLDLRPEVIASLVLETESVAQRAAASLHAPASSLDVDRASDAPVDALVRLLRLLDHPDDARVLAPLIEREIMWRLLTGRLGPIVRQIGTADSNFSAVGRAIRWIREHPAAPFRVEELAAQASMSVSTFHRHFRAMTTMSPVQFQKRVRLQQARLMLMGEGTDVAGAGYSVGYDSPSQFSREYRREFGTPPGQDAARLRAQRPLEVLSGVP
jgi:AraC-like DNA-binding protein